MNKYFIAQPKIGEKQKGLGLEPSLFRAFTIERAHLSFAIVANVEYLFIFIGNVSLKAYLDKSNMKHKPFANGLRTWSLVIG